MNPSIDQLIKAYKLAAMETFEIVFYLEKKDKLYLDQGLWEGFVEGNQK